MSTRLPSLTVSNNGGYWPVTAILAFHRPWRSIHFQWIATVGAHLRTCFGWIEKDAPSLRLSSVPSWSGGSRVRSPAFVLSTTQVKQKQIGRRSITVATNQASCKIRSAPFSATISTAAWVLPLVTLGKIDASTMRRPSRPWTLSRLSTTDVCTSAPIAHEPHR